MGNVERTERMVGNTEPFDYETENAVRNQVNRVERTVCLVFYGFNDRKRKKCRVKDELGFSCRPLNGMRVDKRNDQTLAATGDEAVHARAGERKNKRNRKQIENGAHVALEYFCPDKIKHRHKEDGAEQAHCTVVRLAGRFEKAKQFNARDSYDNMKQGNNKRRIPLHPEAFPENKQPDKRCYSRYSEQKPQCVGFKKSHFCNSFRSFIMRDENLPTIPYITKEKPVCQP